MTAEMTRLEELTQLAIRVNSMLIDGALPELPVVDEEGEYPLVFALEHERLAVLLRRVQNHKGFANIFVLRADDRIVPLSAVLASDALGEHLADNMTGAEQPSIQSSVGSFVDYLVAHGNGVMLPSRLVSNDTDDRTAQFSLEPEAVPA